jgi:hypothetical protein
MKQTQFILNEVAKIVGVKAHVIAYAISSQTLPEPKLRIAGKRVFSAKEVDNIKTYFNNRNKKDDHDK